MSDIQDQPAQNYPVFTKRGDASIEVEELIAQLRGSHGDAAAIGLHKYFYVMRVDMTVVMVTGRDTPLAEALRAHQGWSEPKEEH
jgi:hypothetical protein